MNDALITETTNLGIFCECRSCGSSNYSDAKIIHRSRCTTKDAQYGVAPVAAPVAKSDSELRTFARNVRTYGQTKGRDADVLAAVRAGYLSESDAMNTDD